MIFFFLLENLFTGLATKQKDRSIQETVESALTYLDQRTEFWRQQKPMYARKREKELKRYKPSPTRFITIRYPLYLCFGEGVLRRRVCLGVLRRKVC